VGDSANAGPEPPAPAVGRVVDRASMADERVGPARTQSARPERLASLLGFAVIAALLIWAALAVLGVVPAGLDLSPAEVEAFAQSWGMWSVAGSISLMVLHSFVPVPAEVIAVAIGMMFGPYWGIVVTWSGAMLGAVSAFAASRWLGRPFVCRFVAAERRAAIERWTVQPGSLLLLRLIPVVSFNLVNFAAGLAGAGWWSFLWTTGVGILPLTVVSVMLGSQIFEIAWWVWALAGAAVVAVGAVARKLAIAPQRGS
jgi:uncharacterized membrane protein YdjX (TVP38/TMEM64 family)